MLISGVWGGGTGAGFLVRPPPPSCQAEYPSVTAGRTLGVTDQDLRWLEVWLGNRQRLAGLIRAVVPVLLPQAHCCGRGLAGGGISLGHGVAPGGAWYNDYLEESIVCTVIVKGGCGCGCDGGVSMYHYFSYIKMIILQDM